jgi:hypothetical protein
LLPRWLKKLNKTSLALNIAGSVLKQRLNYATGEQFPPTKRELQNEQRSALFFNFVFSLISTGSTRQCKVSLTS